MNDLLAFLATHGDTALFWVLTFVSGLIGSFILKQMKEGTARNIVSRALTEVGDAVLVVTQTYVSALKAAAADGKLTDMERQEAKAKAIAEVKKNLGVDGLKKLAKILGLDLGMLDGWLGSKVEAAVAGMKASAPVVVEAKPAVPR